MLIEECIVQNSPDAIIAADTSGKIILWNPGAKQLFGFSAAEAVNQSLDIITPDKRRTGIGRRPDKTPFSRNCANLRRRRRDGVFSPKRFIRRDET